MRLLPNRSLNVESDDDKGVVIIQRVEEEEEEEEEEGNHFILFFFLGRSQPRMLGGLFSVTHMHQASSRHSRHMLNCSLQAVP